MAVVRELEQEDLPVEPLRGSDKFKLGLVRPKTNLQLR
jgi:hypothetical protein